MNQVCQIIGTSGRGVTKLGWNFSFIARTLSPHFQTYPEKVDKKDFLHKILAMFDIILTGKCKHIEDKDSQVKHTNELSFNEIDLLLENISISLFQL